MTPQKPKKKFMFLGVGMVPRLRFQTTKHRINRPIFDLTGLVSTSPAPSGALISDSSDFLITSTGDTIVYG